MVFPSSSDDAVTSELSKLLHEIKKCQDRDYSFEELCQTISSHSMDSFGSGRLSDEERADRPNGTLTRVFKVPLQRKILWLPCKRADLVPPVRRNVTWHPVLSVPAELWRAGRCL